MEKTSIKTSKVPSSKKEGGFNKSTNPRNVRKKLLPVYQKLNTTKKLFK